MKYNYVFWDWNGTLFDDTEASWLAVNDMLAKRGLPLITIEQYRDFIDVPIIRFYEKVMDVSVESMESLSVEFNMLYTYHLKVNPIAQGAYEVLAEFSSRGIKQYIFSSSQNKIIIPRLQKYGIDKYFINVLGADDCYVGSKVQRTCDYISHNNIPPSDAVFIGDMVHDSEVASLIGSDCILISGGHQCESALNNTGRLVLNSLAHLKQYI